MDKFLIKRPKLSDSVDHSKSGTEIDFSHCKCFLY